MREDLRLWIPWTVTSVCCRWSCRWSCWWLSRSWQSSRMFSGPVSCDPCVHQCEETKGTNSKFYNPQLHRVIGISHSSIIIFFFHIFFQHSFASRYSNDTEDPEVSSLSLNEWLLKHASALRRIFTTKSGCSETARVRDAQCSPRYLRALPPRTVFSFLLWKDEEWFGSTRTRRDWTTNTFWAFSRRRRISPTHGLTLD